jgi:lipopolysaccharide export system protein LptA
MILAMNFSLNVQANKKVDFGTISIKADQITFNDAMEKLSLNNNIEISFDKYVITAILAF